MIEADTSHPLAFGDTLKTIDIIVTMPSPDILPDGTDLDKLAKAVARFETGDCTLGYGAEYNNCFGIKNGNTAPCKRIGRNRMCIYDAPQESYDAFKIIWKRWYDSFPSIEQARRWSGNHNAENWVYNVKRFYDT